MIDILRKENRWIREICKKYDVKSLWVFGSATSDSFDESSSDIDFLVEFGDVGIGSYADCYFGLLEDLETLFNRPIDLVIDSAIKNPHFRVTVSQSRQELYAA